MTNLSSTISNLWSKADRPSIRAFFLSIVALTVAMILALYSGAAAQLGNVGLASGSALSALLVAGWVGVTLVPVLAKRTPLRWIGYRMEYRVTRQGWIYLLGIVLVALAALNTGNNLLFLILASLIASILMSGILSSITLAGVELGLQLPEHIFAGQPVRGTIELKNEKLSLPSFSLRVEGADPQKGPSATLVQTPVYFPYLPRRETVSQSLPLVFSRRGVYRQEAFRIVTRFPFGFLQKARRLDLVKEALVYPSVEASQEFLEIRPGILGAMESLAKGRGQDLYALRGYLPNDSARLVHWKASARSGALMVREFAREDDSNVLLVFDPYSMAALPAAAQADQDRFERAVTLCAAIAWDFRERNTLLEFRSVPAEVPLAPAVENIYSVLRLLALAQPIPPANNLNFLQDLAANPDAFKIVVTSRPRGSMPPNLWHSAYIVFAEDIPS
ncbi:MAG TPA: DUF58 domain-containing protein [Candidatus Acidoferrum sp.]|nr:DUF58 domain-containing protein [Candidatus Acidoferrum sp.]